MNKYIKLSLMEMEDPLPLPDKSDHYYRVKMDAKEFNKLIKDSQGNLLKFTLRKGFMSVLSENKSQVPVRENFRDSDQIRITPNLELNPEAREISVAFDRNKMLEFKSPQSSTQFVYLEFHDIKALHVIYYIDNNKKNGFFEYYLAASLSVAT
jgi:hypothetical protein